MACSESSTNAEDLISNLPDIVIDKILDNLPIDIAAQTSVLSKQWRQTWLSLKSLIFDFHFWYGNYNIDSSSFYWQKRSHIISTILLHHNGPIHHFYLDIPDDAHLALRNHSHLISFLSKNGVQDIIIYNSGETMDITSYIFSCRELVDLKLVSFKLSPPPPDFIGFPYLTNLELLNCEFINQKYLYSLIESCKMLTMLRIECWEAMGMAHIVIDAPTLQTLTLVGDYESLAFGNVRSLKSIALRLIETPKKLVTVETIGAINFLANSCQLQKIEFNGQFLAAGGIMRSPAHIFNQLYKLHLSALNLSDFGVSRYVLAMIECCPYIRELDISIIPGENVGCQNILDYNYNYKLVDLLDARIDFITGSSAELKFVKYLLAISPVLENLFFTFGEPGIESQLELAKALMRFPRASTKASLVCL